MDSIIPLLAIAEISTPYLVSLAEQVGLSLNWSQTPKTGFSHAVAQIILHLNTCATFVLPREDYNRPYMFAWLSVELLSDASYFFYIVKALLLKNTQLIHFMYTYN